MVAVNINNRNGRYALTVGTRYHILDHSRGIITLRNDNGLRASYSESLFNIVEEEAHVDDTATQRPVGARIRIEEIAPLPEPEPEPEPEPVLTPFTDRMVCDSVVATVRLNNDNGDIQINVSYNTKQHVEDDNRIVNSRVDLHRASSSISCGVNQIIGIRNFENLILSIDYQLRDFEGLVETIFNKIKESWEDRDSGLRCAIYIASDVYTPGRERLMGILGFENVTGTPVLNRNSQNPIVVYQKCIEEDRIVITD